jgi:TatD DNase family protein
MSYIDTHCHLGSVQFDEDRDEVIARMMAEGADKAILICCSSHDLAIGEALCREYPGFKLACGIHPHAAAEYQDHRRDFTPFFNHGKLLAIGEIGLDYFYDYSDRTSQITVLEEFLEMALQQQLPAMLHLRDKDSSRQAYDDALAMLGDFSRSGGRFVIHCYAGIPADAEKFLAMGGFFGVTGMYTFKAAHNIREAVAVIPDDRLLIETDSPYLAPVPYRGRSNTPGMVALVAQALGAARNMTPEAAAELFTGNGKRFYNIGE